MIPLLRHCLGWLIGAFRSREDLILENLALRQQLLTLHAKRPRPRLGSFDKFFWVALRKIWPGWRTSLILVTPQTVTRWHRTGFRLYWAWLLIFDRDAKFNGDVIAAVKDNGMLPIRTAFRSPWQNGVAERWVGSVR
jgi:transposase InsO family protein